MAHPLMRLLVQPRIVERQCGLVREGLRDANVFCVEDAASPIGHGERPDHHVLHHERHGHDGPVRRSLDVRAQVGEQRDAGIRQDVRRRHRAPLANGERAGPRAGGQRQGWTGRGADVAGEGEGDQVARFCLDQEQPRLLPAQQRADAVGDEPRDDVDVERLGERAPEVPVRLGGAAARLRLGEEPRVVDGHRGLGRKRRQQHPIVPLRQHATLEIQREHAQELVARHHRGPGEGHEVVTQGPRRPHDARISRDVLHEQGLAMAGDPPRPALPEGQHGREVHGAHGGIGGSGSAAERLPRGIHLPEHRIVRAGELGDRAGDLLEQGLEVELLRERPIDVREGADSVLACGDGGLGSPTLVHGRD